jgi:putative toxin-antitoxin system antitoxin component (TIGR02293 family)
MENFDYDIAQPGEITRQIIFPEKYPEQDSTGIVSESLQETYSSRLLEDDGNFINLVKATRKGLPYRSLKRAQKIMPFSQQEWADILHLSSRSIDRLKKDKKSLGSTQSEKLIEVTLLYDYGIEVFGSVEKFSKWLNRPSLPLGGFEPKSLLDTNQGMVAVKQELSRIDYGVLA